MSIMGISTVTTVFSRNTGFFVRGTERFPDLSWASRST